MASENIVEFTDQNFEAEVLKSDKPVLVDFWAEWCPPCHAIAPSLEELSTELAGQVRIVKLNVDDNPQTASRYQIGSIPTLLIFKNGAVIDRIVGAQPKQAIVAVLNQALSKTA